MREEINQLKGRNKVSQDKIKELESELSSARELLRTGTQEPNLNEFLSPEDNARQISSYITSDIRGQPEIPGLGTPGLSQTSLSVEQQNCPKTILLSNN